MTAWIEPIRAAVAPAGHAAVELLALAVLFFALAYVVKGRDKTLADGRAAAGETRINMILSAVDQLVVSPILSLWLALAAAAIQAKGLHLPTADLWTGLGEGPTLFIAVFLGDFAGYWRHRLQHTPWLWPAHAIHHSDTRLTWFSLERMHPIDRLGTALDIVVLTALGLPVWAVVANSLVRHYYGYFIHTDLPWTLGKFGLVFNSPAMHRWHHARDIEGSGANFATLFSIFDRAFGTYYQPGPCEGPLGVREDMGKGALGQYLYPFREWGRYFGDRLIISRGVPNDPAKLDPR